MMELGECRAAFGAGLCLAGSLDGADGDEDRRWVLADLAY